MRRLRALRKYLRKLGEKLLDIESSRLGGWDEHNYELLMHVAVILALDYLASVTDNDARQLPRVTEPDESNVRICKLESENKISNRIDGRDHARKRRSIE
jgi:hypothetical protein